MAWRGESSAEIPIEGSVDGSVSIGIGARPQLKCGFPAN